MFLDGDQYSEGRPKRKKRARSPLCREDVREMGRQQFAIGILGPPERRLYGKKYIFRRQ